MGEPHSTERAGYDRASPSRAAGAMHYHAAASHQFGTNLAHRLGQHIGFAHGIDGLTFTRKVAESF